jgi:hypothetical protein
MDILPAPAPAPAYNFTTIDQALKDLTNNHNRFVYYVNLDKNVNRDLINDPELIRLLALGSAIGRAYSDALWDLQLAQSSGGNNKKTKRPSQTKRGKSRRRR